MAPEPKPKKPRRARRSFTEEAEQAAGVNQISDAVSQMGHVTQQNAASSEESSSAAAELAGQAQQLAAMVASFQLGKGQQAVPGGPRQLGAALRQPSLQA